MSTARTTSFMQENWYKWPAPAVQKVNSAIHRINLYPQDSAIFFPNTYPLDSYSMIRWRALSNFWAAGARNFFLSWYMLKPREKKTPTRWVLYFNEFLFRYVLHFFTHWLMNTWEKYKKRKRKLNIYKSQTHTQLHTDIKERKKNTPVPSSLFTWKKKLKKINNKWSKRRKDRMLIRFIFPPFPIVGPGAD